jgi:hypothetical protein
VLTLTRVHAAAATTIAGRVRAAAAAIIAG